MVVFILEKVPVSLRGELSRWMLEPKAGVFVGRLSGMVREKLWTMIRSKVNDGAAMMIWRTNTEQGFKIDFWGNTKYHVLDWEGLQLICKPQVK